MSNVDYLKPQTSMNNRLNHNNADNLKSLLVSPPLSQKMSQTQYQNFNTKNSKILIDKVYK